MIGCKPTFARETARTLRALVKPTKRSFGCAKNDELRPLVSVPHLGAMDQALVLSQTVRAAWNGAARGGRSIAANQVPAKRYCAGSGDDNAGLYHCCRPSPFRSSEGEAPRLSIKVPTQQRSCELLVQNSFRDQDEARSAGTCEGMIETAMLFSPQICQLTYVHAPRARQHFAECQDPSAVS